ncbi:MAG: hypothetical protein LLF92_10070 [Planctomycetaceae bacterium]|nr:hypothetical protein [Planctomycetaceae bacterium]
MTAKSFVILAIIGFSAFSGCSNAETTRQINIPRIDQMPDFPQPYIMRDWSKVAKDFDKIIFDTEKKGEFLPLAKFETLQNNADKKILVIPSYVCSGRSGTEAIVCLGAISSRLIAGLDKKHMDIFPNYFTDSQKLYLNRINDKTGQTFWYEMFPSVLFYRTFYFCPESEIMQKQFYLTADQWQKACVAMGGKTNPRQIPNFDYTAFDFSTMTPFDNNVWKEADAAAAAAWIEYIAYVKSPDNESKTKYLNAAKWSMDFLEQSKTNPYYEILMPLGAYTAARMNAQTGTNYDVEKFVNWCFDGSNWRKWGATTGKWGNADCAGLIGSVSDNDNMYGFTMNTFDVAASLVPLVRYDERFANAIGKWMLNAANSARLFYPDGLDANQQTDYEWSKINDPQSCIAYEGLRQRYLEIDRVAGDLETVKGKITSGDYTAAIGTNKIYECIEENQQDNLEHIWKVQISKADRHILNFVGKTDNLGDGEIFQFSYSLQIAGRYEPLFDFNSQTDSCKTVEVPTNPETFYLKVTDTKKTVPSSKSDRIYIDDIWIESLSDNAPYATGDAKKNGWAKTNLGIYGSAYVGIFGGIIQKTNIEGIIRLDCLATDFYHAPAYPTYLYYNPFPKEQKVVIELGTETKDIYESISNKFISTSVTGKTFIGLAPKSAAVIVICPANGKIEYKGKTTMVNGMLIDYQK